jgi:hypothetical protein
MGTDRNLNKHQFSLNQILSGFILEVEFNIVLHTTGGKGINNYHSLCTTRTPIMFRHK